MNIREYALKVDMYDDLLSRTVTTSALFVKGDENSSFLNVDFLENGTALDLSDYLVTATVQEGKNPNTELATIIEDAKEGRLKLAIPTNLVDEVGANYICFRLHKDGKTRVSAMYKYYVINALEIGVIGTEEESSFLASLIKKIQELIGLVEGDSSKQGLLKDVEDLKEITTKLVNDIKYFCTQDELETLKEDLEILIDNNSKDIKLRAFKSEVYTRDYIDRLLTFKADVSDLDDKADKTDVYTKDEVFNKSEVYNKQGVENLLINKVNIGDVYNKSQTYTKSEVDTAVGTKSNKSETYTKSEVDTVNRNQDVVISTLTKSTLDLRKDVNAILDGSGGQTESSDEVKSARVNYKGIQRASLKLAMDDNVEYVLDEINNPNPYQVELGNGDYIDGTIDDTDMPIYNIKGRTVNGKSIADEGYISILTNDTNLYDGTHVDGATDAKANDEWTYSEETIVPGDIIDGLVEGDASFVAVPGHTVKEGEVIKSVAEAENGELRLRATNGLDSSDANYKESLQTIQLQEPLRSIPNTSIRDELLYDGTVIRRGFKFEVLPSFNFTINNPANVNGYINYQYNFGHTNFDNAIKGGLCDKFPIDTSSITVANQEGLTWNENGSLYIRKKASDGFTTVQHLKDWLTSIGGLTIYGVVKTPVIEKVATPELTAQGYTHFFVDNALPPTQIKVSTTSVEDRTGYIMVMSNRSCVMSYNGKSVYRDVVFYDANKTPIGAIWDTNPFTTPPNCFYVRVLGDETELFMLNEGSTVYPYEAYRCNEYNIPCPTLRSNADDTVYDEIKKGMFIQRVDENCIPLAKEKVTSFNDIILKSFASRNHIWFMNDITPNKPFTVEYIASTGQIVASNINKIHELRKDLDNTSNLAMQNLIANINQDIQLQVIDEDLNHHEVRLNNIDDEIEYLEEDVSYIIDEIVPIIEEHTNKIDSLKAEVDEIRETVHTHMGGSFSAKTIVANMYSPSNLDQSNKPRIWISDLKITLEDSRIVNTTDIQSATLYLYGSKNGKEICFKTNVPLENTIAGSRVIASDYNNTFDIIQYIGMVITFKTDAKIQDVEYHIEHDVPANKIDVSSNLYVWDDYVENSDPLYDQFNIFNSVKGHIYGMDYDNPQNITSNSGTFKFTAVQETEVTLKSELESARGSWYSLDARLDYIEKELENHRLLLPTLNGWINSNELNIGNLQNDMSSMLNLYLTVFVPRLKTVEAALGIDAGDGVTAPGKPRPTVSWEHASYQSTNLTVWFFTNDVSWDDVSKYDWQTAGLTNNQNANSGTANTYYQFNWGHARTCVCVWKTDLPGWNDNLADAVKVALFNHYWITKVNWQG